MINILPYQYKKFVHRMKILRLVTTTLGACTILALLASILNIPRYVSIRSRTATVEAEFATLKESGIVISDLDVASLETRVQALKSKLAEPKAPTPVEYIGITKNVAATGIVMQSFSMIDTAEPKLKITGTATTREILQRFVAALEAQEMVASVESPISNFVKSTNSDFTIIVSFKKTI